MWPHCDTRAMARVKASRRSLSGKLQRLSLAVMVVVAVVVGGGRLGSAREMEVTPPLPLPALLAPLQGPAGEAMEEISAKKSVFDVNALGMETVMEAVGAGIGFLHNGGVAGGGSLSTLAGSERVKEAKELRVAAKQSLRRYSDDHFSYCVADKKKDFERTFAFGDSASAYMACKEQGLLTGRLCRSSEVKLYFDSFTRNADAEAEHMGGLPRVPDNRNCNRRGSHFIAGCQPGFASSFANASLHPKAMAEFVTEMPQRDSTLSPSPCCEGFFCPANLACMIPCPLGAYCPQGSISPSNYTFCSPYEYQAQSSKCGGAALWAVAWKSSSIFCPVGYYCSNAASREICPIGYFCRQGSTSPTKCSFGRWNCPVEGIGSEDLRLIGGIITSLLFLLLFAVHFFFDRALQSPQSPPLKQSPPPPSPSSSSPLSHFHSHSPQALCRSAFDNLVALTGQLSPLVGTSSKFLILPDSTCKHIPTALLKMPERKVEHPISIRFESLSLSLQRQNKRLLFDLWGELKPGCLSAVMGPSGAGKSTFLSAIAGRAPRGSTLSGRLLINGRENTVESYRRIIGYVPQDDIVHANLTVEENLWFSANYRLPLTVRRDERALLIERTLQSLGLTSIRHSQVGCVEKRGISGGQRKRVNVGIEMVMEPSLLMLDEPTSGLDSTSSRLVVEALQREARRGVNVVAVIHQPSYSVFCMFDEVLLLANGGRSVFHGLVNQVEPYFASHGFHVPKRMNPPDFFMDVLEGHARSQTLPDFDPQELPALWKQHAVEKPQQASPSPSPSPATVGEQPAANPLETAIALTPMSPSLPLPAPNTPSAAVSPAEGEMCEDRLNFSTDEGTALLSFEGVLKGSSEESTIDIGRDECSEGGQAFLQFVSHRFYAAKMFLSCCRSSADECCRNLNLGFRFLVNSIRECICRRRNASERETPGFASQFWLILNRSVKQRLREPQVVVQDYLMLLIAGLAMGVICSPINEETLAFTIYPNTILALALLCMITGLRTFDSDILTFHRESSSGINRLSYFLAKDVMDYKEVFLKPLVFLSIFYHFTNPRSTFVANYVVALALFYCCTGMSYILGITLQPTAAQLCSAVFCLVSVLVATRHSAAVWVLYESSFARWALEALVAANARQYTGVWLLTRCAVLGHYNYHIDAYALNVMVLFLYGILARLVALFCLFFCNRSKN